MNCMHCNIPLTKKQITNVKSKKREIYFCSKKCAYESPLRNSKISDSSKGKIVSEEHKESIRKTLTGRKASEETKRKLSELRKGKVISEEHRNSISQTLMGHEVSEETRMKLSQAHKGRIFSEERRKTMNLNRIGIPRTKETKDKISKATKGKSHDTKGIPFSEEQKRKIAHIERLTVLKQLEERLKNGEQLAPNWNLRACDYFEKFDLENQTQGQHARNDGGLHIRELGYWVDYINHDRKLIMEYDEEYHLEEKQMKKDIIRQKEIQELFPDYEFLRIKEEA